MKNPEHSLNNCLGSDYHRIYAYFHLEGEVLHEKKTSIPLTDFFYGDEWKSLGH